MQSNVKEWLAATITPIIDSFDEKIKATESQMTSEKIKSEKLSALLKQTENLARILCQKCQMAVKEKFP